MDGANSFQKFVNITLPGLRHATVLVLVTQIIASFQIFGQVNIMTAGGPGGTTDVLVRYIYQTGFRDTQLGYASAMSLVLFVLMVFISLIQFLISRQKEPLRCERNSSPAATTSFMNGSFALLWLIPLLWTLVISRELELFTEDELADPCPHQPTLSNYVDVF